MSIGEAAGQIEQQAVGRRDAQAQPKCAERIELVLAGRRDCLIEDVDLSGRRWQVPRENGSRLSALDFCPGDVALDTEQPLTKLKIVARLHAAEEAGGVGGDCRGKQAEAYSAVVGQVDRAVAPGIAAVQPG